MTRNEYTALFEGMISEIGAGGEAKYDSMFSIAELFVKPFINRTVRKYPPLASGEYNEDIYHDVLLALIKTSVDKFLYKDGALNNDPEGYMKWIFTVAKHTVLNYAKKNYRISLVEAPLYNDEGKPVEIEDERDPFTSVTALETLNECFVAAMNSGASAHILIVWLLRTVIISGVSPDCSSPGADIEERAVDVLVENYSDKTLNGIYAVLLYCSRKLSWMDLDGIYGEQISEMLESPCGGVSTGEKTLSDFYMKKGASQSVSAWVSRINGRILSALSEKYGL